MRGAATPAWHNWSGGVSARPRRVATPASETELVAVVQAAARAGQTLRVVGSGHSFTPLCATDGVLVSLDRLQGLIRADARTGLATFWAGSKLWQLGEPLRAAGLALANMGDIDRQSLAGAISTGTHGTGRGLGNLSTQVAALRWVDAAGRIVECGPDQGEGLRAARLALGSFGVLTQITLRVVPAYRLHERSWLLPFDACLAQLDELIDGNRHFEFFWVPGEDVCAAKTLNPTERQTPPDAAAPAGLTERTARYVRAARVDHSDRIFPSARERLFNELEFAVPLAAGPDCLRALRALMRTRFAGVDWPLEYRTLAADDGDLSPAYQRESVTISVHQGAGLPHAAFFAAAEAVFRDFQGRPHWGKLHGHGAAELRALYPRWEHFHTWRRHYDPRGLFLNPYLRRLFGLPGA